MSEGGRVRRKRRSRIPVRQATGLYVHSSPPTVVPVHPSIIRQWLRGGEINRLQEIVLKKKIDELHAAARIGKIENVDTIINSEPRVNLELSRDNSGTGILHKAVIHGHVPLQEWLLKNYPKTVEVLDKEKRNPLHYAGGNEEVWNRLVAGGADTSTVDREGNSPAFYMNHPRRLRPPAPDSRSKANLQANQGIVVKPSNIRIWIHDKDLGRLQKVLWEGMGDKLKTETSSQPLVRRFLNAVPYIMGSIREVHSAAINNDIELLKSKTSDPVPKDILLSKDVNGLNALHKAAGLGNLEVARAIIDRAPEAVNSKDYLDRTPLHYAAAVKDQNQIYQLLVDSNATDHLEDKKGNTPSHYRARPSELDGSKLLNVVPDAPRTAHIFPPSWDWRLLTGDATIDSPMTSPQVEASSWIPDAKEPEEPKKQVEERRVDDKPPEIEPSPEGESLEKQVESKDETEPPGISDDEGVGSEANPSLENTSTPLSDTMNEEEEISGARLGETMTLTTSLFSSSAPRTEEFIIGMDSGNEDSDPTESMVINVENREVEPSPVDSPTSEDNLEIAEVREDQELQNATEKPEDQQGDLIQEISDEQLPGQTSDTLQSDKGESKPNLNDQPSPEADTSATIQGSKQDKVIMISEDVSFIGEEETDMLTIIKNDSEEQTDNQNNLTNSDSINVKPEQSAESEEEDIAHDGNDREDSNRILGSTQDLNTTYTEISYNDASEEKKDGDNDTAVDLSDERPSTQNRNTQPDEIPPSTPQDQLVEKASEYIPENDTRLVEESQQAAGTKNMPANLPQHQNIDRTIDDVALANVSASNIRPSSRKSVNGTPQSRGSSSGNESSQKEVRVNNKYIETNENSSLEGQSEGKGLENENVTSTKSSKKPEDGNDSGSVVNSGLDLDEIADGGSTLGSQIELHTNNDKPTEGDMESSIVIAEVEGDVRGDEKPNGDGNEDDDDTTEFFNRPVTTRSAGASRAEILAITPAPTTPPEIGEDDGMDAVDQKAVEGTEEEDRTVAEELVIAGDMESMAEMVLNGRGSALLNMTSNNPDVQLFINNIPQYITKIERVHVAAREGDLRGVQTALDRRKFAVARDNSTPLKPTPLHVATLFGRTSVLRYLAGRFPETMHAQDAGGRTALHYAATLPDNGHFHSLLVTLGADKSVIDNEGKTADYYLRNKGELSREELLNEYQNRPVPVDTTGLNFNRFSDKVENDQVSSRKDVDDQVLLTKLDACLRLIRMRAPGSLLSRILQDDVYQEMKLRSTRLDNGLLDLITPSVRDIALGKARLLSDNLFTGLSVPDYESYKVFEEILLPTIREVNGMQENDDTPVQPPPDYFGSESKDYFLKMNIDPSGIILKSFTLEISRNLQVAALPQNLKLSELEKCEVALTAYLTIFYKKNKENTFTDESGENYGSYYSLSEVVDNKEVISDLKQEELIAEGMDEPIAENWPYGRGVFISPYGDITAWINIRDHLKLFSITSADKSGAIGQAYYSAFEIITLIEEKLDVKRDSKLGYLTSDPALVGSALRFKALLNLPHLSQDRIRLRKLCKEQRLLLKPSHKTSQYRVFSTICLGITEIESFKKYVESLNVLIEAERDQMKSTIMQVPTLIKSFLHKKSK